jgi:hypothetical protein
MMSVQDHIIHGHAPNFCGSMRENKDGAVSLLRPDVMPLPEKELSMVSPEFLRVASFFWCTLRDSNSRPSDPLWVSLSALLLHTGRCRDRMLISLAQKFGSRL